MSFANQQQTRQIAHREAQARVRLLVACADDLFDWRDFDLPIDDDNPIPSYRKLYKLLTEEVELKFRGRVDLDKRKVGFESNLNYWAGCFIPYTKSYERIFTSIIENEPLQEADKHLTDFVVDSYWGPIDTIHLRYNGQVLQERVNELRAALTPDAEYIRLPRLLAAIDWLKDYEQRLVETRIDASGPALDKAHRTIDELCKSPFDKVDLDRLLQHLRIIDSEKNCLTNHLKGKGAGPRSKFTAAYLVLQRAGLMEATANNAEWANAFLTAYRAEIGEAAQSHELTAHGHATATSSQPFKKGVAEVTAWVSDWRENQS